MQPDYSVYLVTDRTLCVSGTLEDVVARAVQGGVTMVQLREKQLCTREFVELGRALRALLAPRGVPLLVNDRVDVALACGADAVPSSAYRWNPLNRLRKRNVAAPTIWA
jgi:thiamine-phosphate pyrophosphorylase